MVAMTMTGSNVESSAEMEEPWPRESPELPPALLLALALYHIVSTSRKAGNKAK